MTIKTTGKKMGLDNINDNNLAPKNSKKYLDYCENFFIERISADFHNHLELIGNEAKKKLSTLSTFSDKQALNDFIQKCLTKKQMLALDFKLQLKKSFSEQSISGNLNNIKLNWININTEDKEYSEKLQAVQNLIEAIRDNLGENLLKLLKTTNFLLTENKDLFDSPVLAQAIFMMLKNHFSNHKTIIWGLEYFTFYWPSLLTEYYSELNKYLIDNVSYEKVLKANELKQSGTMVLDFNSFLANKTSFEEANNIKNPEKNILEVSSKNTFSEESNKNTDTNKEKESFKVSKQVEQLNNQQETLQQTNPEPTKVEKKDIILPDYNIEIKHAILEAEDVLTSQHVNNDFININELLFKTIDHKPSSLNLSNILNNPSFIKSVNDLQKKILRLPLNYFNNEKVFKTSLLNEFLKNKSLISAMNCHDLFIFRLLTRTYSFLLSEETIPVELRAILFKTQFWILQFALSKKAFLYDQNHPGRIFLSYLLNNETLLNSNLTKIFFNIISSVGDDDNFNIERCNNEFLITLINQFKHHAQKELNRQVSLTSSYINKIQESEKIDYFREKLLASIKKITNKTQYLPLKAFIEQSWLTSFINTFSNKLTYEIVDSSDFVRNLPLEVKLIWHQSSLIFDMMILIAENNDFSSSQIEKIKSFFNKINEGLAKQSFELNIDHAHIKNIINILKAKFETPLTTSNPVLLEELKQKNSSNEKDFILESNKYIANWIAAEKTDNEIITNKFNFENFVSIDDWYCFNKNIYKLVYASPRNKNFILVNLQNNTISHYSKMKLWYVIKSKAFTNITKKYSYLNFLDYLIKSISELKKEYGET